MSMSTKPKRKEITEPQATSTQPETGEVSLGTRRVTRKSGVARTKSISNSARNQAMCSTIGLQAGRELEGGALWLTQAC
jgi:hypothetical protein